MLSAQKGIRNEKRVSVRESIWLVCRNIKTWCAGRC
jgi:hypothetical protein